VAVPVQRVRVVNARPVNPDGGFVVYWMTAARRVSWNFGLEHAAGLAREFGRPLVVLEALRCDYPHASDRLHTFVLRGMAANASRVGRRARYYPYVEPGRGAGRGLIRALSASACAIVTDDYPAFGLPRMLEAAGTQALVRLEAVDSNGLIPLAAHGREFPTARGYRAFMQRELRAHLAHVPGENPLASLPKPGDDPVPPDVRARWPETPAAAFDDLAGLVARLPIDHSVPPAPAEGGSDSGQRALRAFIADRLASYGEQHNHPDADVTSRLSPYLHFGHVSAHEIFAAVMTDERWTTRKLSRGAGGAREGWWGVSPSAEAFLDQLTVWRELAFNGCAWTAARGWDALPRWARQTLDAHLDDPRPHLYSDEQLETAATHDPIWNAAERQLVQDGWFHGYMRMVWGKKILEWSAHPADALARMERLMDRYSLDGRDPVSYASYGWVLGRYDRPWFERPIFGTVRYMTSESAARKLRLKQWLARYGPSTPSLFP
jgi:deoxyribodipyrimidine photo-lyase